MSAQVQAYETVAQLIVYLREHAPAQPELDVLARQVGLSPSHLQRLFSRWAGISPKRFVQYLTKQEAKRQLRQSRDVLSAALASGLSGPGRLHDLMVQCEAVTPGEYGAQGEGLTLSYGVTESPFGRVFMANSHRGICHLSFVGAATNERRVLQDLQAEWPQAELSRDDPAIVLMGKQIFNPLDRPGSLSVLLKGTNFQIKVWEALLGIPAGCTLSYGDLAGGAGSAGAQRAVGSALAANRIAYLIPCHRVIRGSGETGQYRWQGERKAAILGWERARSERRRAGDEQDGASAD